MNRKPKKTSCRIAAWLLTLLALWGCEPIYDNMRECHVALQFKYDYNMTGIDRFALECNKVELFLFDSTGKLRYANTVSGSELSRPGFSMEVPLSTGSYTAVAWVGRDSSYELSGIEPGVSTKDDLILKLLCGEGSVRKEALEPLWYGDKVISFDGRADKTETISLVRNSNTVNLSLLDSSTGRRMRAEEFAMEITASNGSYDADNNPYSNEIITYKPFSTSTQGEYPFKATMKTLRLIKGKNVRLSVKQDGASVLPTEDIDLIEYVLKTKPESMNEQEYLDREHIWNIELYCDNDFIAVMIKVNGWTVWTQGMDM